MTVEERLRDMGLSLPETPAPLASYVPAVRAGNLVYTSGQIPSRGGSLPWRGSIPRDVTVEEGVDAARQSALNALAAVQGVIGDLDMIRQIVRVTGYVNSAEGFTAQSAVINGASDLLLALFGERGKHSRAAIGVYQLPNDAPVEVDLIVEVGA
ncbi:MAG: RidA family protein [Chloroflexota bacterium]